MNIKKASMLLICCFLMVFLSACGPIMIHLDQSELENKVDKVELIQYENPGQKKFTFWFSDHSKQLQPFYFENVTILQELPSEKLPGTIDLLCKAEIREKYYAFNAPIGICLKITYSDGSFMIYYCDSSCRGYVGIYAQDGEVLDYIGSPDSYEEYASLISKYFNTQLD